MAAWADGINLTDEFGTLTITSSGITSRGAELMSFNGIAAPAGRALGAVSFSTGAMLSGTMFGGGDFSSAGSCFVVTGVGAYGQPKGTIFTGDFVGPIAWALVSHTGKWDYVFQLSGKIRGELWTGREVTGTTTQTILLYKNQWQIDHKGGIHAGASNLAVPEPGTLGLLATGLIGIAGTVRRKFSAV